MRPIEIRLDPQLVASLLDTISPVLEQLESELASPAIFPDEDTMMEDFWKKDLLDAQREEVTVIAELFDDEFMETGRATIDPDDMDRVIRACSAIRLKLRDSALAPLSDEQLEEGDLEGVHWEESLQIGYAAYALFASLQELIVSQMGNPGLFEDEFEDDD